MIRFLGVALLSLSISACAMFGCNDWLLQSDYPESEEFRMLVCKDLIKVDKKPFPENLSYEKANELLVSSDTDLSSCKILENSLAPHGRSPQSTFRVLCESKIPTEQKIGQQYIIFGQ